MRDDPHQDVRPPPCRRWGPRAVLLPGVLATVLTMVWMVGCDQEAVNPGESTYVATSSTTIVISAESFYLRWGETATILGGVTITASAPAVDPEAEPMQAGRLILYSVVEMTNGSNEPFSHGPADFYLYAELGFSVGGVDGAPAPRGEVPLLASGTLQPGQTIRGAVAFELSPEAVPTVERMTFIRLAPPVTWMVAWSAD